MKLSYWTCDLCGRPIIHGAYRYNCTVCKNFDECEMCESGGRLKHPHPLVRELAFGDGELDVRTGPSMAESIYAAMNMYRDRQCLGIREVDHNKTYLNSYKWYSYRDIWKRVRRFATGLRPLVKPREYLGICAANRPDWIVADLACQLNSIIIVPIYNKMSDRDTEFVINNTKISTVICDKETLPKFLQLGPQCPSLRQIISMDSISDLSENKISIYAMQDIEEKGTSRNFQFLITNPKDCHTIIYTSGSSGMPKGVIISDRACRATFPDPVPRAVESVIILYQPLVWYGGRNSTMYTLLSGGRIGFATGETDRLMEDIALIRPTVFATPPNIWNKIYTEFKGVLALKLAESKPENHGQIERNLLEKFSKLIPLRCTSINIVGALISPVVLNFVKQCFRHCAVIDSYGITECGAVAFSTTLDSKLAYRLESVPEMGFTVDDKPYPRGELLTKTPQLFSGYVNNPKETEAALTKDGFFRTGDIVELCPVLNRPPLIRIIDRKKNFFKLSHGQFVSPEYLEGVFTRSPLIDQVYIHADLEEDCIVAVVIPNREHVQTKEPNPKLNEIIMNELKRLGKQASLQKHEIPSRIFIDFERFSVENGLLTSSMKPCRPQLAAHYKHRLKSTTDSIEQRLANLIENATGQTLTNGFAISGGNSLAALRLSRLIENDLGTNIPVSVLFEPDMDLKRLADLARGSSSVRNELLISRLLADAEIDLNITIGKPKDETNRQPTAIFITGVTGFVGAFLLKKLIDKYPTNTKFLCLVRCETSQDPIDRIKNNLESLHLWQEQFRERIIPIRGDLSQAQFGLTDEAFINHSTQTDLIFHCGATVNFILPYSQLYGPNVVGTREILRFATATSSYIPIHYISTISVLPPDITNEISIDQIPPHQLPNGYGQSKWVAEKLVSKAIKLGLPIAIYRLGSMCADTQTGACNPLDSYTLFLKNVLKVGTYPLEILHERLDTLPVDFAVESIISSNQSQSYGQVYHIVHPNGGIEFKKIVECETKLKGIPMKQWREEIKNDPTSEFVVQFVTDLLINRKRNIISSKQFYTFISPQTLPPMNFEYVTKWLKFISQNFLTS